MKPIKLQPLNKGSFTVTSSGSTYTKPDKILGLNKKELVDLATKRKKFKEAVERGSNNETSKASDSLQSLFKRRLKKIKDSSIINDYGEQYRIQVYKALMDMVLDLIPVAENKYRLGKEDKSMYALNVVINQAREIANDMRAVQDFEQQALQIIKIIRRNYTLIAQNFVDEIYRAKKAAQENATPEETHRIDIAFKSFTDSHALFLNETLKAIANEVSDFLVEKPDTKPGKDKKGVIAAGGKGKFKV